MTNKQQTKSCILCGSTKIIPLYETRDRMLGFEGNFFLKKCGKCNLAFLDPQPSQETLKKYYPSKKYYAYNTSSKKGSIEKIREYLIRHYYSPNLLSSFVSSAIKKVPAMPTLQTKGKILDLGCGTGDTLALLQELGWEPYGLDIDSHALLIAKKRGLKNLKLGTYRSLKQYPDNFFDAIRLYHVIEHLDEPSVCLKLIKKKLKQNGELIVGTPNISSLIGKIFKSEWYNLDSPRHLYLFSPYTLKKMIQKEGFKVKRVEFVSAGGIVGSLQYFIEDRFGKKTDLIHKFGIVLLFYPFEWLIDKFKLGDVFTITAYKK